LSFFCQRLLLLSTYNSRCTRLLRPSLVCSGQAARYHKTSGIFIFLVNGPSPLHPALHSPYKWKKLFNHQRFACYLYEPQGSTITFWSKILGLLYVKLRYKSSNDILLESKISEGNEKRQTSGTYAKRAKQATTIKATPRLACVF
jgi:hypothetical protein